MSNWLQDIANLWNKESSEILETARFLHKITEIAGARKNILFFDPIPWNHNCVDMLLARALQLRGHNVISILCQDFPICELERYNHGRNSCCDCLKRALIFPGVFGIPYKIVSDFLTNEDRVEVRQMIDSVPADSLYDFLFQGLPIGLYARHSVTGYFRFLPKDMTPKVEDVARRYIRAGVLNCIAAMKMIRQLNIDIVVTTGGESPLWAPIFKIAKKMGKRAYNWENSALQQKTFVFSNEQPALQNHIDKTWEKYKNDPLTPSQRKQVDDFISGRAKRKMQEGFRTFDEDQIRRSLNLDSSKRIITLFPGLPWDGSIYGLDRVFEHPFDWLLWMTRYAAENPDINLVIRSHPAEVKLPAALVPVRVKDVILEQYPALPENVKIIEPDSAISSHVLAQMSDVSMVCVSTMGMEIAILGKMPWVIGKPHYISKGFTRDITDTRQLRTLLDAGQISEKLSEEQIELAKRYLCLVYFRHMVEMPFYQGHDHEQYVLDSFARLLPNGNPVLNDLCEAILNDGDFVDLGKQAQDELVSIITPFHNMEKTLAETIESVLFQSYQNWEMILIDDGSSDQSVRIARQYAEKYPDKIKVITHEGRVNAGASASRNLGFTHTRGRYIAYLDADDIWLPDKLSFEIRLLREHPDVGMVMSPVRYFYENPKADQKDYDQDLSTLREGKYPAPAMCAEFLRNFGISACPSATLIRREMVEKNPWESPFRRNFTDQVFWAKVTSSTCVYVTKRIVTCYRQHENSSWEIAHRENTFEEQNDKFWSWIACFSDRFDQQPQFKKFLMDMCEKNMSEQTKADYIHSRKSLIAPSDDLADNGMCRVNYKAQRWLERHIAAGMNVFKYGSDDSTVYLLSRGCRVISVEHDREWYANNQKKLAHHDGNKNHSYILREPQLSLPDQHQYCSSSPECRKASFENYVRVIDACENESLDMVWIGDRARVDCIRHALPKLKPGGYLILPDAKKGACSAAYGIPRDYQVEDFYGFSPGELNLKETVVFTKPVAACTGRNEVQVQKEPVSSDCSREISFGSLRRLSPVSRLFGSERMTETSLPLCWTYIRRFLAAHAGDIKGRVLEIGDNMYTRMFGGNRVVKSDILHAVAGNSAATIVADLTKADNIPSDTFDCIICTQTLQCIYDVRAAVKTLYRILKPGGVLLVSGSGISQISRYDMDRWGEYWRFTTASFKKMFEEYWPEESIEVRSYGNVLVAMSYLQGLVSGDLDENEINFQDDDYQMIIVGRAVKPVKTARRISDHAPQGQSIQPCSDNGQKAGREKPDEVRLIADGWDQYAKEWDCSKFKVLPGHQVRNIGDEWTAEDVSAGGTTYGLPKEIIDRFDEYISQSLLNSYLPSPAGEGLEIGPGGGRLTKLLIPRTKVLHLADSSETMLARLKERFAGQTHLRYYHTNGMSLPPLKKASLDYVVAFDVFVHFEPRLIYWYLCQISQLLKPGGVCIIHYANAMTEIGWKQFESDLEKNVRRRDYFASFGTMCPQFMEKFLQSLGFTIHSVDTGVIPRDAVAVFSKPVRVPSEGQSARRIPDARDFKCPAAACKTGQNPSIDMATDIRAKVRESSGLPQVLLYHRVADDPIDSQLLAVSPVHFRQHLEVLRTGHRVVPLRQLLNEAQTGNIIPHTVALTFDDGYLDNLTHALPLLKQYGMHATVFVTTDSVQRSTGFWWDKLEALFLGSHALPELLDINDKDSNFKWPLRTTQQRLAAYDQITMLLKSKSNYEIEEFVYALFRWAGLHESPSHSKSVLTVSQLQELSQSSCIEIGSHAMTHTRLSVLSVQQQEMEIKESRKKLESWIGKPVTLFSYPYGTREDYAKDTKILLRQAGFQYGIANNQGSVDSNTDWLEVPRRLVRNWPGPLFDQWMRSADKDALEQQTRTHRTGMILRAISGSRRITETSKLNQQETGGYLYLRPQA